MLEAQRVIGVVTDGDGQAVGEARLWIAADSTAGGWSGWLRVADLRAALPPGRYTLTTPEGQQAAFAVQGASSRVFETSSALIGEGAPPWATIAESSGSTCSVERPRFVVGGARQHHSNRGR
ncbi:MAG: hypothetical protein U0531_16910 [Dehalococcoidia bacterium]